MCTAPDVIAPTSAQSLPQCQKAPMSHCPRGAFPIDDRFTTPVIVR